MLSQKIIKLIGKISGLLNNLSKLNYNIVRFFRDNHDLSVYVSWDPERIEGPPEESKDIADLFTQNVQFLKLRTHILWALSASINIVKANDSFKNTSIDTLKEVLKDWEDLYYNISSAKSVPIKQVSYFILYILYF